MTVLDRFLKYVTFDTQSNEETGTTPSTPGQRVFAEALVKELEAIGMEEISLDENSYVMATLPANTDEKIPTIGFIAHLDTSPDMSGKNVQPRIVTYLGGDIVLDAEENVVLSQSMFPELSDYRGQDIIVTNGKTLLGADDKGGVAAIVASMQYLKDHPEIKHGKIRIAFTPMRKSDKVPIISTWRSSVVIGDIRLTVDKSVSWNMRISMPPALRLSSRA